MQVPNDDRVLKYVCMYLCLRTRMYACVYVRSREYMEPASRLHTRTHTAPQTRGDAVDDQNKLLEP